MTSSDLLNQTPNLGRSFAFHLHEQRWRLLKSGSSEVGLFRLKPGTTHLKRELEFRPLGPIPLKESHLGDYLERELLECNFKMDDDGDISVRLGPNKTLGPIAGRIAFVYKLMLPKKFDGDDYVSKQKNEQSLCES